MSTLRQQLPNPSSAKNLFRKQKSIDLSDKPENDSKKFLQKQTTLSEKPVDHASLGLKHVTSSVPITFNHLLWGRNSAQRINESNFKILPTSAVTKRSQYATSNRKELLSDCMNKTGFAKGEGTKTRVNINIFLSQDALDEGLSDVEGPLESIAHNGKPSGEVANVTNVTGRTSGSTDISAADTGRLSVSARRAQFQASRRVMSAPIRPMNMSESSKRKTRKKKIIRVNLTLNRDKEELDESQDELQEEIEIRKAVTQPPPTKAPSKAKALGTRSRSVLGCDQIGIETLVSMLSSGGSDSEKEEQSQATPPPVKPDIPRTRSNMLRKTVSFQDDDSFFQPTVNKDSFGIRKNTNITFAGRMRNTRSLFGQEISNLYLPTTPNVDGKNCEIKDENDINSTNKSKDDNTSVKSKAKKVSEANSDDKQFQGNQTPKEQECWRLYEKMKKTGLNVSYDTILRGILKPSELRLLEKQKKLVGDVEEKPAADEPEAEEANATN